MSATTLFCGGFVELVDANDAPIVGGKISIYEAGTSTPCAVYTDSDLSVPWTQPIVTNAAGQTDGPVYVTPTPSLRIVAVDATDVMVPGYPIDPWTPCAVGA